MKLITGEKVSALQRSHLKGELTVGDDVELEYTNSTYVITKLFDRKISYRVQINTSVRIKILPLILIAL